MDPLLSLPDYSPSSAAPIYAERPSFNELTLDHVPRVYRVRQTSSWSRKHRGVTVTLHEQEESASIPTYGRNGNISGVLAFKDCDGIEDVSIRVEGCTDMSIDKGASSKKPLVCQTRRVWSKSGSVTPCPASLSFRVPFPSTSTDAAGGVHQLPPSYARVFPGTTGFYFKCSYTMTVVIESKRTMVDWSGQKCIVIPLKYYPRSCPPSSASMNMLPFLRTLKEAPDEWFQVVGTVPVRATSSLRPVECHLFIPRMQTFAICDPIPLFVQLQAPVASLQALFGPATSRNSSGNVQNHSLAAYASKAKSVLRLFLYRQIRAEINGQRAVRTIALGEADLRALTPDPSLSSASSSDDAVENLDWEGEVRCTNDETVGGFAVETLTVKDFIVLEIRPSCPHKSPLLEHQLAHPIRLTTNRYIPG